MFKSPGGSLYSRRVSVVEVAGRSGGNVGQVDTMEGIRNAQEFKHGI